ncbi:MAG: hypothetical protein Q9183_006057, partial [Haloplaca sp. 2 TL-2023]
PWIFRLPITFNGQQSLHKWLSSVNKGLLPNVREIRFKLHDIESGNLMGAFAEGLRRRRAHHGPELTKNPYEEACRAELRSLKADLQQLKGLKTLILLENTSADPRIPPNMVKTFIVSIVLKLPLTSLTIPHELLQYLDQPNTFPVRQLQITGHAFTVRPDFPRNEFPNVIDFKTCHTPKNEFPNVIDLRTYHINSTISHQRSKILFEKLPNLKSVTLCLYDYQQTLMQIPFSLYIAQLGRGCTSLKTFRLWNNNQLNAERAVDYTMLRVYLQTSALEHVETGYYWSPPLNDYPRSVRTIAIRFETNYARYSPWLGTAYQIISSPGGNFFANHPALQDLILYLPDRTWGYETRQRAQKCFDATAEICKENGVALKIVHENFACNHGKEMRKNARSENVASMRSVANALQQRRQVVSSQERVRQQPELRRHLARFLANWPPRGLGNGPRSLGNGPQR